MKLFELFEARRNPEKNKKSTPYEILKKYKDNEDIFISFTEIDKLGINPASIHNTPIGIYAYPLHAIWDNFYHHEETINVPYQGDAPYIWIIKNVCENAQDANDPSYTASSLKRDIESLRKKYKHVFINENEILEIQTAIEQTTLRIKRTTDESEILDLTKDLEYFHELLEKKKSVFDNFINDAIEFSKFKWPFGYFWNITRLLSERLAFENVNKRHPSKSEATITKNTSKIWNYILRKDFGYCAITDVQATGLIHENEPAQAVFLERTAFKVIDRLYNNTETSKIHNISDETILKAANVAIEYSNNPQSVTKREIKLLNAIANAAKKNPYLRSVFVSNVIKNVDDIDNIPENIKNIIYLGLESPDLRIKNAYNVYKNRNEL